MMMMKAEIKQRNMAIESKNYIIKALVINIISFFYISCEFKRSLRIRLPQEKSKNYVVIYDTIINRMQSNSVYRPFKLKRVESSKISNLLLLEVHSKDEKIIITLDSTNKIVKWSNYLELH